MMRHRPQRSHRVDESVEAGDENVLGHIPACPFAAAMAGVVSGGAGGAWQEEATCQVVSGKIIR